jgi:hypothetical protein
LQPPVLSTTACRLLQNPVRLTLRPCQSAAQMCRLRTWRSRYTIRRCVRKAPPGGEPKAAELSEIRKSGKLHPEFLEFSSRKAGSGLLDAWGLPVLPCFPTPLVSVQLRPYFHRTEFLEKNSRKSGRKASHRQSGKVGYVGTTSDQCQGPDDWLGPLVWVPNRSSPKPTKPCG